jgi:hypothetical protein
MHPAVLVGLVHLGTTEQEYNGKKYDRDKILLVWELVAETDSEGKNFIVEADYTFSLNEKAGLRKIIEGWSGKTIPEGTDLDLLKFLGRGCMLNLTEEISAKQKKFIEVASVNPLLKNMQVPAPSHEAFAFDFDLVESQLDEPPIPDWVPPLYGRSVREDIKKSYEWAALPLIPAAKAETTAVGTAVADDDDPPF